MRAENPLGDADLGRVLVDNFDAAVSWQSSLGVAIGERKQIYDGHGHQIDIHDYLRRCISIISSSGFVITGVAVRSLSVDASRRVLGARLQDRSAIVNVRARHTILATGGFQANPALRARYIHRNARGMLVRSNEHSVGDGLRLGLRAGATTSRFMDGFYGHLVGAPVARFTEADYGPLSQYLSQYAILINVAGERFTDESARDALNAQAVVRQPRRRAALVVDEHIRRDLMGVPHIPGLAYIDRFQTAIEAGARYAQATTLERLATELGSWRFDGASFLRTARRYNTGVLLADEPPRRRWHEPLVEPPFHALEVQPAITFTHGGLRVDRAARALGADDRPIPGLLVAGVDAGGIYHKSYFGGLSVALVLGRVAAQTALTE